MTDREKSLRTREYVAGWIKRGPTGVIGTNKQDAVETVHRMLETFLQEKIERRQKNDSPGIDSLLKERNVEYVSFEDWQILDKYETELGQSNERPRVKVTSIEKMMEIIRNKKNNSTFNCQSDTSVKLLMPSLLSNSASSSLILLTSPGPSYIRAV